MLPQSSEQQDASSESSIDLRQQLYVNPMASKLSSSDEGGIITEVVLSNETSNEDNPLHEIENVRPHTNESSKERIDAVPTEPLHMQSYIVFLVMIYAAIFIAGWTILVLTSKRPIGRKTYACFDEGACSVDDAVLERENQRTSWYIKKALTLLATVSLLTIPLTSAVCAAAVVPWLQHRGQSISLRQTISLADKGWTSPYLYYRLLAPSGWKRYGSAFMTLALLLHALGAALSPAVSQRSAMVTIKVPTASPYGVPTVGRLLTVQDLLNSDYADRASILKLRSMLEAGNPNAIQAGLWATRKENCTFKETELFNVDPENPSLRSQCDTGGLLTYLSMVNETDVWQSQLSNGFATGVRTKQYLPRVNSSVTVELVDEMPPECVAEKAALLINYVGWVGLDVDTYNWSIQACIPTYPVISLFNRTDSAQTITETAYLDLSAFDILANSYHNRTKITMSTTIGYFELPNYQNKNVPGPLLQDFKLPVDSTSYIRKPKRRDTAPNVSHDPISLQSNATNSVQGIANLELLRLKGPLLNTIYALFGNGSLPSRYAMENTTYNAGWSGRSGDNPCLDLVPLSTLASFYTGYENSDLCIDWYTMAAGAQMHMFLQNFFIETSSLEKVFRTAAYMSHSLWLSFANYGQHTVQYDAGTDMQKPGLTNDDIIALTIAIGLFLVSLMLLAFYASCTRSWTYNLDAYALLRIGADLGSEALPFLLVEDAHRIGELDELSGWVGDVSGGSCENKNRNIGQLGVGYGRPVISLKSDMKYRSYPTMPYSRWTISDKIIDLCGFICSFGGTRQTRAGRNLVHFRAWIRKQSNKWYERSIGRWVDLILPIEQPSGDSRSTYQSVARS